MLRVLVSNDDGVLAEGLNILVSELKKIAHVDVIAPNKNYSGSSNSITLENPLRPKQMENGFWHINGTPTDCIKLGLSNFFSYQHDLVISGINHGENIGDDIIYSGTVGAATEGRYLPHPPIAISSIGTDKPSLKLAAKVASDLVRKITKQPLKNQNTSPYILNVNVPKALENQNIEDNYQITHQGARYFAPVYPCSSDPRGREVYWLGPSGKQQHSEPKTDFHAIKNNKISITPIHIDLTAYHKVNELSSWLKLNKETKKQELKTT
tara:strand:- start:2315 stop:3115 length:801 start_codon:yes stop_codon:yes gene_type:complete